MHAPIDLRPIDYAERRFTKVGDVEYCYLDAGRGDETVVLLHGYPDNAYSWEAQIRFLGDRGYRVVAPFLRGYPPTRVGGRAYFDRATLAKDIDAFAHCLVGESPVYLVGQDWGAAIGYGLLGAFPQRFVRAVLLAVPHPVEIRRTLRRSPKHVLRSFHWFLFQLPVLPELIIRRTHGQALRQLWRWWSPNFHDEEHVRQAVDSILTGRAVEDTLAYYRAAARQKFRDPALSHVFDRLNDPIHVPTKVLCGEEDMRKEILPRQGDLFDEAAEYEWELVPRAGHFLHREEPDIVNERILDWFERPR